MLNNRNKTKKQWFAEWIKSFLGVAVVAGLAFLVNSKGGVEGVWPLVSGALIFIAILLAIPFLMRTFGVVLMLFFPDRKATDIQIDQDKIKVFLEVGTSEEFLWTDIKRVVLNETFDGILIRSSQKTGTYSLPLGYKNLEAKIDAVLQNTTLVFQKEKQWIQSNQDGLNKEKDPTGVKRTYTTRSRFNTTYEHLIEAGNAIEMITYSHK